MCGYSTDIAIDQQERQDLVDLYENRMSKMATTSQVFYVDCQTIDASSQYEDISLNDVIHQGSNLQNSLVDILTRFRREPVRLMCDISEMYLQLRLSPKDRSYYMFCVWRNLDQNKPRYIYL